MARALINVPATVKRGEVFEIKTLVSHPMETGYRPKGDGTFYPRDIIQKFVCTLNGEEIFRADLFPAMSANPFIAFTTTATEGGLRRNLLNVHLAHEHHDHAGRHHEGHDGRVAVKRRI